MKIPRKLEEAIFGALWRLVSTRSKSVVAAGVLLALLSGAGAAFFLRLNADQDILVSPDLPFQKRYLELLRNFGDQEYLFVVVGTGGTDEGRAQAARFADRLASRISRHPEMIRAVHYRLSPQDLGAGALLYASVEEARSLAAAVQAGAPLLHDWYGDGSLAGLLSRGAGLLSAPPADPEGGEAFDPALAALEGVLRAVDLALRGDDAPLPSLASMGGDGGYFFTRNGLFLIMRLLPAKDFGTLEVVGPPLATVRGALSETRAEFPGVEAGLTGRPVLAADEMETTNRDMNRASVIAIALVGILYVVVLHGVVRPVLLVFTLLLGMAWTYGFATVTVGELNLLSIVFALVLVGVGVDFGAHVVVRSVEEELRGSKTPEAVRSALFTAGPGVLLGALTTVSAFFTVLGADFRGLAELGLIGGAGILLCVVGMLTVLPALLLAAGRRNLLPATAPRVHALTFLERFQRRPALLLAVLAALTAAGLPGLFREHFNYNLLELQAEGLESVHYEKLLLEASDESTWYGALTAGTLEEVRHLGERLRELPTVGKVESLLDFLPDRQEEKAALYAPAARALADLPQEPAPPAPTDPEALKSALRKLAGALAPLEERLFAAGAGDELAALERASGHLASALGQLEDAPSRAGRLAELQSRLRGEIVSGVGRLRALLSTSKVGPQDIPPGMRDLYIGGDGRFQVKATPAGDIWDFGNLERFVSDLRGVDPEASGVPVVVLESARLMHATFLAAAGWTVLLVALILYAYSRSLLYVALTLLPLGVGILWLVELMGWFGWEFNLANFFAIPILIGIGVDGAIHLVARWQETGGRESLFATSTPTAVSLSFLTSMIGFGGLLLAHHRGLASLGVVMVLGSAATLGACLLVLPAALKLFGSRLLR